MGKVSLTVPGRHCLGCVELGPRRINRDRMNGTGRSILVFLLPEPLKLFFLKIIDSHPLTLWKFSHSQVL